MKQTLQTINLSAGNTQDLEFLMELQAENESDHDIFLEEEE